MPAFLQKTIIVLVLSILPLTASAQSHETGKCAEHLFTITKSDNKNVLFYDAVMSGGKINSKKPVDIYWIMYAEKGQREGLTFLENPQFGITVKEIEKGTKYIVNVKNSILKNRNITVTLKKDGCTEAITEINGQDALLNTIYINIKSKTAGIPNVSHLDISGFTLEDGALVTERVNAR